MSKPALETYSLPANDVERELFIKVFWEKDNWKNLFSLAKRINKYSGGYDI
jgi:hypothetical protein